MAKKPEASPNRPNQLNPNHDSYWQSRGERERPENWKERVSAEEPAPSKPKSR